MDLRTKHILAISAVVGASGLIGFFIGREIGYKSSIAKVVDAIWEEIKASVESDVDKTDSSTTEYKAQIHWDPSPFSDPITKENLDESIKLEWNPPYHGVRLKKELDTVSDIINNYQGDVTEEDKVENLRTQGEVEYTSDAPYLITEEEVFSENTNPDDVETLTYYRKDKVLADSFDEIIYDARNVIIGKIDFSLMEGDEEVIYFRNPQTKRDYEVILKNASYEQEVLGADDEQYRNAVKFFDLGDV